MTGSLSLMRELIRNACVNDGSVASGQEVRSVATLVEFFGVEGTVFEPAPGRQSLVYRVKGSVDGAPSLALVPHLDVVPADPDGWTVDPFGAEIVDGFVYGRGAVDMLNVAAALAFAVRPYLTGEKIPSGDLVFCAVADEESGGKWGALPLVGEHWDLVGADYLLTEVAYPGLPAGDHRRIPVSIGEKGAYWSRLSAKGTPGHGSAPYGSDNAIAKMAGALVGLFNTPTPALIGDEWAVFADSLGLDEEVIARLKDVDSLDAAIDDLAAVDPSLASYVHAATHLTISPNTVEGGTRSNVIPARSSANLDIRALPGMDRSFVESHLHKAMGSAADMVDIEPIMDTPANTSPVGNRLWEAIAAGVEDLEGHRELVPTLMTVATDARFWRARGTISYGVGLFDDAMSFSEMLSLFHGHDERVSVESVGRTTDLYIRVLDHFLSP